MRLSYLKRIIVYAAVGAIAIQLWSTSVYTQSVGTWSLAAQIPYYDPESRAPLLISDRNRVVHALNYQDFDFDERGDGAIFYRQWSLEDGWTSPIDIVLPPQGGQLTLLGGVIDTMDTLHLVFFAGNDQKAEIYHTYAPAATADRAHTWSKPVSIAADAGPLAFGDIVIDAQDNLSVVYVGGQDGPGVREVQFVAHNNVWLDSAPVAFIYQEGLIPAAVQAVADVQGGIHAVWSVWGDGAGEAIYYAHRLPDSSVWSEPQLIAQRDEGDYEADWPSIITHEDQIILMYQDDRPATKYIRFSTDGGETWSSPIRPFPHVGEYESAVFLKDSTDSLHVILGNRLDDQHHGMWHSVWANGGFGPLQPIITGPKSPEFDPSAPQAVVSQGNVILATWWTDTGGGPRNGAWYSYSTLDVPALDVVPLATPSPTPDPTPTHTPTAMSSGVVPTGTPSRSVQFEDTQPRSSVMQNPAMPIALSVVPVVVIVLVAMFRIHLFSDRRS